MKTRKVSVFINPRLWAKRAKKYMTAPEDNIKIGRRFLELGAEFGFHMVERNNIYCLCATDTDGHSYPWIKYNAYDNEVFYQGNTDVCNLWLHVTRPDLTPERILEFVEGLNRVFFEGNDYESFWVNELIDPEDWQEIAGINDANEDERYSMCCFIPEKDNPYPLCVGRNLAKCKNCQKRADWDPEDSYGKE